MTDFHKLLATFLSVDTLQTAAHSAGAVDPTSIPELFGLLLKAVISVVAVIAFFKKKPKTEN